jgi:hypothetical protein
MTNLDDHRLRSGWSMPRIVEKNDISISYKYAKRNIKINLYCGYFFGVAIAIGEVGISGLHGVHPKHRRAYNRYDQMGRPGTSTVHSVVF